MNPVHIRAVALLPFAIHQHHNPPGRERGPHYVFSANGIKFSILTGTQRLLIQGELTTREDYDIACAEAQVLLEEHIPDLDIEDEFEYHTNSIYTIRDIDQDAANRLWNRGHPNIQRPERWEVTIDGITCAGSSWRLDLERVYFFWDADADWAFDADYIRDTVSEMIAE